MSTTDGPDFAERLAGVQQRIADAAARSGRTASDVTLVAVSKFHPAEAVREALACGQLCFGENYVQEALAKQQSLLDASPAPHWHFIGHVQTNKAKDVAGRFELIHTVDDIRLAEGLNRRLPETVPFQKVLLQVNLGHEPQKSGVEDDDLPRLAEAVMQLPKIRVLGLMGMPPFFDNGEAARPYFAHLRELRDALAVRLGCALPVLSMGMSGDFEQAIEEGATLIRVGTTLFGPRPVRN
ncbi:MAG TPA: YggS family pyridoxal phosphate-dependent enzyme [Candidatus Avidesulfovibrio excrementigallinarum]|nr:YggS family pyridoxal phosphate-dependent enzyme [Candidatus Avidesulfovibrio excrementigallinarum]